MLGGRDAAEADCMRRWEIIFPEGLTTAPGGRATGTFFSIESNGLIDSGDSVTSAVYDRICWLSVGVGGVTVVRSGMLVVGGEVADRPRRVISTSGSADTD